MDERVTKKIELQHYLESLYPAVRGEAPQFKTRCIFCGDSKKDPNKMRLGIKVDATNPEEPVLYHCFNGDCGRAGVLTNRMLKAIAGAQQIKVSVDSINKSVMKTSGNTKLNRYKNTRVINVKLPGLYPKDMDKARYLFNRIGKVIDPVEFNGLKIVWSLNDFIEMNNLKSTSQYLWMLDKDYIGFLSVNNDFIVFRDITEKHKMRYVKYNVFGFYDNSGSFYSIPAKADLLSMDDIYIIISEGPFDILSILYNVEGNDRTNKIYLSSNDGEFYTPLLHYFEKGFVGSNIYIDAYKDNDSDIEGYVELRKQLKTYTTDISNIRIYYNGYEDEKDFGVPKNKIQREILM